MLSFDLILLYPVKTTAINFQSICTKEMYYNPVSYHVNKKFMGNVKYVYEVGHNRF